MANIRERSFPPVTRRVEQPLVETMRALVAGADVVSFDVFDTLITRAIAQPTDAFALVKLRLLATDAALHDPRTIDAFPELRVQAELRARDDKERDGHAHREVTLDEILRCAASSSGADAATIERLKQTELAVERDLVYANPVAKELFELAREQGKTVVLCSDMYLPSAEIVTLLRRCGYEGYDTLYVSCEHACSKHAGTMFAYVAERHGVAPARVLHVGDNLYGDCMMAREAGCTALYLPPPAASDRLRMPWNGEQPFYPEAVGAIVAGLRRKREHDNAHPAPDPWEELGFRVFGPLFTGFLLWLAANVRERRPEKLLFLARDMHFIHKHLAAFLGVLPDELPGEYLYVSRGSLLLPSLTDFPLPRLGHLVSGKTESPVRRHLRRLGLLPDPYVNEARSAGFADLDELVTNGDPRMRVLLGKLHHESAARRRETAPARGALSGAARRRREARDAGRHRLGRQHAGVDHPPPRNGARRRRDRGALRRRVPLRRGKRVSRAHDARLADAA